VCGAVGQNLWDGRIVEMGKYQVHQADVNEAAIVQYLRAHGAQVQKIGEPVDLLVTKCGHTAVAEVKGPKGKLRPVQEAFLATWRGISAVLRTEADCDEFLKRLSV
jgi:hypothetical protein